MLETTLNLTTHGFDVIQGLRGTERLTVRDMTFSRPRLTTTQGQLVSLNSTNIVVKISDDFPQPGDLLVDRIRRGLKPDQGLFLKRFRTGFSDGPHIVTNASCTQPDGNTHNCPWPATVNAQINFVCGGDGENCPQIREVGPSVWSFQVSRWPDGEMARYSADIGLSNALVGIKIKHGGQAYNIRGGKDLAFISVRWLGHSRGILFDCSDVVLRHTRVERVPQISLAMAMSTPGGGPQVNTCNNLTVFNHTAIGTGDDSLGLFHIQDGSVSECHIRDSFARGILLCNVSDRFAANVQNNDVIRCPIWRPPPNIHVNSC